MESQRYQQRGGEDDDTGGYLAISSFDTTCSIRILTNTICLLQTSRSSLLVSTVKIANQIWSLILKLDQTIGLGEVLIGTSLAVSR